MPLLLFVIFIFVWYFPIWKRQGKKEKLPRFTIAKAIGTGMIPGFLVIILFQVVLGYLQKALALPVAWDSAFSSFIGAALVEETVKFLGAWLIIRKVKPVRKVDYVLIFGAVGLGYEVTETLLLLDSVIAGVARGIFAQHIIWQLWMGMFYWEYCRAKENNDREACRKNLVSAFFVPFVLHGINDFVAFMAENAMKGMDNGMLENMQAAGVMTPELESAAVWVAVMLLFMVFEFVFQILCFKKALKVAKQSREAENIPETDAEKEMES